jgi:hypothetical protein
VEEEVVLIARDEIFAVSTFKRQKERVRHWKSRHTRITRTQKEGKDPNGSERRRRKKTRSSQGRGGLWRSEKERHATSHERRSERREKRDGMERDVG